MKKTVFIVSGITMAVIGAAAVAWAQTATQPAAAPAGTMAAMANKSPTAPVAPVRPAVTAPVMTAPVTAQAQHQVVPSPVATAPAPVAVPLPAGTPVAPPTASASPPPAAQDAEVRAMQDALKKTAENDFRDKLSFPLTEDKMLTFVRAAVRVEKANQKWDVQIAGAESDKMAIEYSNFAVEESSKIMASVKGITIEQFNELSQLTAKDDKFNRIYLAYKQLVEKGVYGTVEKPAPILAPEKTPGVKVPVSNTTFVPAPATLQNVVPQQQPVVTPRAAPVNPGTPQVPAGSPKPPYSPPAAH